MPASPSPSTPPPGARLPMVRLSTFYGGYFLVVGVLSPFWPLYLEARGVGPSEIGLLFALTFWLRALAAPPVGRLVGWPAGQRAS